MRGGIDVGVVVNVGSGSGAGLVQCRVCDRSLPPNNFYKSRAGIDRRCKECEAVRRMARPVVFVPDPVDERPVPGCPGYFATADGEIHSVKNGKWSTSGGRRRSLRSSVGKPGYLLVHLSVNGVVRPKTVHRLVCLAFHGAPPHEKSDVRHLDGNRLNNRPSNLAWGTRSENEADKRLHGRRSVGEDWCTAKLSEAQAIEAKRAPRGSKQNPVLAELAARFGVSKQTLRDIRAGRTWRHLCV